MDKQKAIIATNLIIALRNNLPDSREIKDVYVNDYHSNVYILEVETGLSLAQFRVPYDRINPKLTSLWPAIPAFGQKAGVTYSKDKYCEKSLLLSKMDALISYLNSSGLLIKEEDKPRRSRIRKRRIGFQ